MTAKVLIPQMGPRGLPGAQLIELVNAPTAENGNDGDYVIRSGPGDDTTLYGPKANGAWPAGRSIRGNVGGQGPIGLQGSKGDPGPPGPAGQQGVSGFKGWSPIFAAVDNGSGGSVWQLADWINGQCEKPGNIGYYIGTAGLVAAVGDAYVLPAANAAATTFDNNVAGLPGGPANVQAAIEAAVAKSQDVSYGALSALLTPSREFLDISPDVAKMTLHIENLSTNGAEQLLVQLGTNAGWVTAGYNSARTFMTAAAQGVATTNNGFAIWNGSAAQVHNGVVELTRGDPQSTFWSMQGSLFEQSNPFMGHTVGNLRLPGALDRVRVITGNGTDIGTSGSTGITYFK